MFKQSYSDVTTDAEQILTSTAANPDLQPIVAKHRSQIDEVLSEIKSLKTLQKTLAADKQRVTQDLQTALKRLKELLIFLRAAIRGSANREAGGVRDCPVAQARAQGEPGRRGRVREAERDLRAGEVSGEALK